MLCGVGTVEVLAVEVIVLLFPHARNLANHFIPHQLRHRRIHDVEGLQFMTTRSSPRAKFKTTIGYVVKHCGAFSDARWVFFQSWQTRDARCQMDVIGLCCNPSHDHLGGRHVAVFDKPMMFAKPGIFPVVFIGKNHIFGLFEQLIMLGLGIVCPRSWQIAIDKYSKFHKIPNLCNLSTFL